MMNNLYSSDSLFTRQSGFSMIELMISIVIASVGLLGLASMQATGLKSNHSAYHRSQATVLVYDMADRMRSNMGSINAYLTNLNIRPVIDQYIMSGATFIIDPVDDPVEVDLSGCTSTSGCTSDELALKDLLDWNNTLANTLPGAVGTITLAGDIYTIRVRWDDNRDGVISNADPTFQVSFQL